MFDSVHDTSFRVTRYSRTVTPGTRSDLPSPFPKDSFTINSTLDFLITFIRFFLYPLLVRSVSFLVHVSRTLPSLDV